MSKNKIKFNSENKKEEELEEWDWDRAIPTGRAVKRSIAHKKGVPHEGVHLWIVRTPVSGVELLFQHRSRDKDMYPDCLDITVGGHVPFGVLEKKVQKEANEEIGITPSESELIDLGYFRYEEKSGYLFHREFQQVFLLVDNRPLDQYSFTDGEVDGIFSVKLSDLAKLLKNDFNFQIEGYENSKSIYKYVSRKDFHPLLFADSMKEYLNIIIKAVEDISQNRKPTVKMPSPV